MDCWSLSHPLDDEFEKLVNRMNPPRSILPLFPLFLLSLKCLFCFSSLSQMGFLFRVTIDNDSCSNATLIKVFFQLQFLFQHLTLFASHRFHSPIFQVHSANKRGSLLEVVQVLNDLNLTITRAYISSDGGWFMDGQLSHFIFLALNIQFSFNSNS